MNVKSCLSAASGTSALKEHFLETLAREHLRTLRVLKAYPEDKNWSERRKATWTHRSRLR
jgi:hypothetical protein